MISLLYKQAEGIPGLSIAVNNRAKLIQTSLGIYKEPFQMYKDFIKKNGDLRFTVVERVLSGILTF
jgi:hypothetical protein